MNSRAIAFINAAIAVTLLSYAGLVAILLDKNPEMAAHTSNIGSFFDDVVDLVSENPATLVGSIPSFVVWVLNSPLYIVALTALCAPALPYLIFISGESKAEAGFPYWFISFASMCLTFFVLAFCQMRLHDYS